MSVKDSGFTKDKGPKGAFAFVSPGSTRDETISRPPIMTPRRHIQENMGSQLRFVPSFKSAYPTDPDVAYAAGRVVRSRAPGTGEFYSPVV